MEGLMWCFFIGMVVGMLIQSVADNKKYGKKQIWSGGKI
jgi:hypothetical protein